MALVNPNIAMSFRQPEFQAPNALAQYAQIQQIQSGQRQAEVADMQMEALRRDRDALSQIQSAIVAKGGPPDLAAAADAMIKSGKPEYLTQGMAIRQKLADQAAFAEYQTQFGSPASTVMPAAQPAVSGALGSGTFGIEQPVNALAPKAAAAPSVNAMAFKPTGPVAPVNTMAGKPDIASLEARYGRVANLDTPGAKAEAARLLKQIDAAYQESGKLYVVPNVGLVRGSGDIVVDAGMAPTDIRRLTTERDKLPVGHPDRKVYNQAIADIGAQTRVAQQRLAFDKNKFEWEKANPSFEITEDPSGLVAVNKRTGQAFPVLYGPNGITTAAPSGSTVMRQPNAVAPSQRIPVIPGMNSVLDQNAPAVVSPAPTAGTAIPGTRVPGKLRDAPENFIKTDNQLANLTGSLKSFKDEVKNNQITGAKGLFTGADTARMTAKYQSLLMGVKDLYTLGALTGPDLGIIESQLTNPASWSGKMTSKKGFEEQIQVLEDMLKRNVTNLENSYGRQPKASKKALETLGGGSGEWSVVR